VCRWLGYFGNPIRPDWLLYKTGHGLIEQSLAAREMDHPINADGFGLGWYGTAPLPGIYRNTAPAWSDANLRELAVQIESPLFVAHVRASTGTAVQQTNCHPFRHGRWLFVHNGVIKDFDKLRRELVLAVDPSLFAGIQGSTDSEVLFHLALTFGLEDDPLAALERAIGFVEERAREHGIENPVQTSIGVMDGKCLWAVRYSTERRSRTLFASADAGAIRQLHPENARLQQLRDEDRLVVSEPLADLPGVWVEIPEASALIVQPGADESRPFRPAAPKVATVVV
jgi:predicted glutamine amidotransferase